MDYKKLLLFKDKNVEPIYNKLYVADCKIVDNDVAISFQYEPPKVKTVEELLEVLQKQTIDGYAYVALDFVFIDKDGTHKYYGDKKLMFNLSKFIELFSNVEFNENTVLFSVDRDEDGSILSYLEIVLSNHYDPANATLYPKSLILDVTTDVEIPDLQIEGKGVSLPCTVMDIIRSCEDIL